MIILFWNCQKNAQTPAIRELWELTQQTNLDCVCLAETKVQDAQEILTRMGWQHSLKSLVVGLSGGLIFAWHPGLVFITIDS